MNYAKLIDGKIRYAPRHYLEGDYQISNPTPEMLTAKGYLPVTFTDPPEVEPGYIAVPDWEDEGDEIVQTWSIEEEPDEVDDERAMEILFGGEGG